MDYKFVIKAKAKNDLKAALDWYKLHNKDLSQKLFNQISESLEKLQNNPFHFQEKYKELIIAFTKQFPYGIYFLLKEKLFSFMLFFIQSQIQKLL